jgi:hypothetical protein
MAHDSYHLHRASKYLVTSTIVLELIDEDLAAEGIAIPEVHPSGVEHGARTFVSHLVSSALRAA